MVIFISILGGASLITLTERDVINMTGLVDMICVSITTSKEVLFCAILVIAMLDILGFEGIAVFGGMIFWLQLNGNKYFRTQVVVYICLYDTIFQQYSNLRRLVAQIVELEHTHQPSLLYFGE